MDWGSVITTVVGGVVDIFTSRNQSQFTYDPVSQQYYQNGNPVAGPGSLSSLMPILLIGGLLYLIFRKNR